MAQTASSEQTTFKHHPKVGSATAYLIVFLGASFYLYEFFLRVMPTVITEILMDTFAIGASQLGQLLGCFFYAYALMQLPAGLLCDRYGAKRCLTIAVATCAMATLCFQATTSYKLAMLSRLLIGAASAFAFVGPLALSSKWFRPDQQAFITGCVQIMGCIGAVFAGKPIVQFVGQVGWQLALYYAGLFGLIMAALFSLILRNQPGEEVEAGQAQVQSSASQQCILETLRNVAANRVNWYIGFAAFGSWAAVAIFAESWGVPFLSFIQNQSAEQSAQQLMWVWVSMAVASPLAGWISDYLQARILPTMCLLGLGLVASLVLVIGCPSQPWIVSLLLFALGVSSAAQPITFGLISDLNHKENMATAIALNNMILVCSTGLLTPISGYLLELFHPGVGMPTTLWPYQVAFMVVPISIAICMAVFYLKVPETNCQPRRVHKVQQPPYVETVQMGQSAEVA